MSPVKLRDWCARNPRRPDFLEALPRSLFDLLDKCLMVNPRHRITADEALRHEFFRPCHEAIRKQIQRLQQQGLDSLEPGATLDLHGLVWRTSFILLCSINIEMGTWSIYHRFFRGMDGKDWGDVWTFPKYRRFESVWGKLLKYCGGFALASYPVGSLPHNLVKGTYPSIYNFLG